ncbi:MAG: hypothetical protein ACLGPL_11630 [Acidobacteriota bacterium]
MVQLACGSDPVDLGIKNSEGWNITAFLDHLEDCDKCSTRKEALIAELNALIGSRAT